MIKTPLSIALGGAFWTPGATILGSSSKNPTQLIKSIFGLGEQGFAYDPNDLTTLYQDASGTIPVTAAGQPVGLMLDKSKGLSLGTERLQSPVFEASGWAVDASISFVDGKMICDGSNASGTSAAYNRNKSGNPLIVGKSYRIEITVESMSGPLPYISTNGVGGPIYFNKVGSNVAIVTMAIQAGFFFIAFPIRTSCVISNISIKELAGNHAYQTVSAMRPLLVAAPQRLDYDAVDDKLITNLPAQLTGCTVVRSVPNVGTQILTNQTIPTPHNDNTDHCGLIVINRALTASETSQITQLFNKAAGV